MKIHPDDYESDKALTEAVETIVKLASVISLLCTHLPEDKRKRIRQHIDEKQAQHDVKVAERDADWAEADALDAIAFASEAIQEAEYAVLDATLARMNADALVGSTSSST